MTLNELRADFTRATDILKAAKQHGTANGKSVAHIEELIAIVVKWKDELKPRISEQAAVPAATQPKLLDAPTKRQYI